MPEAEHNWAVIRSDVKGLPTDCEEAARWVARDAPQSFGNTSESIEMGSTAPSHGSNTANAVLCAKW